MYHSLIGKKLVAAVNRRNGTNLTVREFFSDVFVPLIFANSRLLMNVNNSPFDQTFTKQKLPFSVALRDECLRKVHEKVEKLAPDASFFLGGPAAGNAETTSGQVTSIRLPINSEDVYASWIGAAAGLTVEGGLTILIDAEDLLSAVFDGWSAYRKCVDQTPNVKALQINTWNGQWVASKFREPELRLFTPLANKDGTALETQRWVELLFSLSAHFRDAPTQCLTAYVYSLGQMNKTLGFIRLNLPEVRRPADLYNRLFTVPFGAPVKRFESLYQTAWSFQVVCKQTEIGLRALKPKDVFNIEKGIPKAPNATDAEKRIAFDTYQTWIIAMLNNMELLKRAEELADKLSVFQGRDLRTNVNKQLVESLLEKKNRREFIDGLTKIIERDPTDAGYIDNFVPDFISLSSDNVPLFLSLLRMKYAVAKAKP